MKTIQLALALVLITALAGCAPAATPAAAPATAGAALTISGAVAKSQSLTMDALKAMPSMKIKAESPKAGPQDYAGVRLNALLDLAQPNTGAANLTLVAGDGFMSDVTLAEVRKCADCLISINGDKLDAVMPGLATNTWVRGLIRIEVK
jgi:hypothetical protein